MAGQTGEYSKILFLDDNSVAPDVAGKCAEFERFRGEQTTFYPALGNNESRLAWAASPAGSGLRRPDHHPSHGLRQPHGTGGARCGHPPARRRQHKLRGQVRLHRQLRGHRRSWLRVGGRRAHLPGRGCQGGEPHSPLHENRGGARSCKTAPGRCK